MPTPLDSVPTGTWLCPSCVESEDAKGLVEGVQGRVIWLWYAPHAQHHRAVVDGVHKELQGERLGSVTKVHVRFEDFTNPAAPIAPPSLPGTSTAMSSSR